MISLESCRHKFAFDPETQEVVCTEGCGWVLPILERRELAYAFPGGRKLSSPSVRNSNLGSDENAVIQDLRKGVVDSDDDGNGKRIHLLSGGLRFFGDGHNKADEDLIVELSSRLHGRVSDSNLAAIAAVYRRALGQYEKEKRRKANQLLDTITGGNGYG